MSNPSGTDHDDAAEPVVGDDGHEPPTETESETEVIAASEPPPERRYTAPGFDAGSTQIIDRTPDPETEIFSTPTEVFPVSESPVPAGDGCGCAAHLCAMGALPEVL